MTPEQVDRLTLANEIDGCDVDLIWFTQAGSVDRKQLSTAKRDAIVAALRAVNHDALFERMEKALEAMVDRWEPDCSGQDRIMWENAVAVLTEIAEAKGEQT